MGISHTSLLKREKNPQTVPLFPFPKKKKIKQQSNSIPILVVRRGYWIAACSPNKISMNWLNYKTQITYFGLTEKVKIKENPISYVVRLYHSINWNIFSENYAEAASEKFLSSHQRTTMTGRWHFKQVASFSEFLLKNSVTTVSQFLFPWMGWHFGHDYYSSSTQEVWRLLEITKCRKT